MATNTTLTQAFGDIADAIRAKGVTGTMTPLEMPTKIESIPSGGGAKYGATADDIFGNKDSSGKLLPPTGNFKFNVPEVTLAKDEVLALKLNRSGVTDFEMPALLSADYSGLDAVCKGCTSLSSVNLSSLEYVGGYALRNAFSGCTSLSSVDFQNLKKVGGASGMNNAFTGCTKLRNVYMPQLSSVVDNSAMQGTFANCTNLELVDFSKAASVFTFGNAMFQSTNSTFKIKVPVLLYETWKATTGWSNYASQIVPYGMAMVAEEANSTVALEQEGMPADVTLEYSTDDGATWNEYVIGTTLTLATVGSSVLWRPAPGGEGQCFGESDTDYHRFAMTGKIACYGNASYLVLGDDDDGEGYIQPYVFYGLFSDCSALTRAPALPATNLEGADYCYGHMFENCTSLSTAPDLPADVLELGCYEEMFSGCTSLVYVDLGYTGDFSEDYFLNWLYDVGSDGDVVYNGTDTTRGPSAIPVGWNRFKGLTFTAREANSTIGLSAASYAPSVSLQYSTDDGVTWNTFDTSTTVTLPNMGDKVFIKATTTNNTMSSQSGTMGYNAFKMTGQIAASGNINSLLDGSGYSGMTTVPQYAYASLFRNCTALVDATNLKLAATTVGGNSYSGMFYGCSNLVGGPEICFTSGGGSATCGGMFQNCSVMNSVKLHLITSNINFAQWMSGVQTTAGTFYFNGTATNRGVNAIPNNWTITTF